MGVRLNYLNNFFIYSFMGGRVGIKEVDLLTWGLLSSLEFSQASSVVGLIMRLEG